MTQSCNRMLSRIQAFRHDGKSLGLRLQTFLKKVMPPKRRETNATETSGTTQQIARHIPEELNPKCNLAKAYYIHNLTHSLLHIGLTA